MTNQNPKPSTTNTMNTVNKLTFILVAFITNLFEFLIFIKLFDATGIIVYFLTSIPILFTLKQKSPQLFKGYLAGFVLITVILLFLYISIQTILKDLNN